MDISEVGTWLEENLPRLRERFGVPGAAVGVGIAGEHVVRADGVLNTATGVRVRRESLFQIGSVTKLWTAVLVMQLVEDGAVELDAPIHRYLPDLRIADGDPGDEVTVRRLLSHTSGIHGDVFTATGRNDDAVERYVADVVPGLPRDVAPGVGFSYSNACYVVLGRLVEVLRGASFAQLLRERIGDRLGLRHWAPTPEDALLFDPAVGHVPGGDGAPEPAPFWSLPAALGPAGASLAMSPDELLTFAESFLDDAERLLRTDTVRRMWEPQVGVPDIGLLGGSWGLGWMLLGECASGPVVGHDGNTLGQSCCLRVVPGAGVAVSTHADGGDAPVFHREVLRSLMAGLVGWDVPTLPTPPDLPDPADRDRVAGRYVSGSTSAEITVRDDGSAVAVLRPVTADAELLLPHTETIELVTLDADRLIATAPTLGVHEIVAFVGGGPGRPATHLFRGGRLTPRDR